MLTIFIKYNLLSFDKHAEAVVSDTVQLLLKLYIAHTPTLHYSHSTLNQQQ